MGVFGAISDAFSETFNGAVDQLSNMGKDITDQLSSAGSDALDQLSALGNDVTDRLSSSDPLSDFKNLGDDVIDRLSNPDPLRDLKDASDAFYAGRDALDGMREHLPGWLQEPLNTLEEAVDVFTGKEARDRKKIMERQTELEGLYDEYTERMEEFADQSANLFMLPEIFGLAANNRARRYSDNAEANLELSRLEYEGLVSEYEANYPTLKILQDGNWFYELLAGFAMIASGFSADLMDIATFDADWDAWGRVITIVIDIILIIVSFWTGQWYYIVAAILIMIDRVIILDAEYGGGMVMSGMFGALDMIINDVLHTDAFVEEASYIKKDNEHYQEVLMYTKIASSLLGMVGRIVAMNAVESLSGATEIGQAYNMIAGTKVAQGLSYAYKAYQVAVKVDDVIKQNAALATLEAELRKESDVALERVRMLQNRKMLSAFKTEKYLLAGPLDVTEMMVAQCASDPFGAHNPEVMIPLGNIGVQCSDDGQFGYEEAFSVEFV